MIISGAWCLSATRAPVKMGLINIFLGIPGVPCHTYINTDILSSAIYSAGEAAARASDTIFTMIYEPAH